MREVPTITIDPDDAKDYDDAISLEKDDDGNWELGVHIADVSFFVEKDTEGSVIDYFATINGRLKIVPEGSARETLAADYASMRADDVMVGDPLPFDDLMKACASVAEAANAASSYRGTQHG